MDYPEAINFLENLTRFGYNFGLQRITYLLSMLGDPHQRLRFVHIGGTNGKGSTAAMVASITQAAGLRTGLYTSPHLQSYTERFMVNGQPITEQELARLLTRIRPLLEQMVNQGLEHPTEFEVLTALAMLYFMEIETEIVVLEVGLGGSIDSTNVVSPEVAVITNVGMDHMEYLGNTIAEIAAVKAGIIKQGCVAVTAAERPEAIREIEAACLRNGVALTRVGSDVTWQVIAASAQGMVVEIHGLRGIYRGLHMPLAGHHQAINAATAVTVVELLTAATGLTIETDAINRGLAQVSWPGRLELVRRNPAVLLDVAHNRDGAQALKEALKLFSYRRLILVIGMLADKEREAVVSILAPLAYTVIVTRPLSPRAGDWQVLAERARELGIAVRLEEKITAAVQLAEQMAACEDLICITGSFYMVAAAREAVLASNRKNMYNSSNQLEESGNNKRI